MGAFTGCCIVWPIRFVIADWAASVFEAYSDFAETNDGSMRKPMMRRLSVTALAVLLGLSAQASARQTAKEMQWIRVGEDKHSFVLARSGQRFMPWGFNYDRDARGRLLEDYWRDEWPKVEKDFAAMKKLGANVVRIHLQLARFMERRTSPMRSPWNDWDGW